MLEDRTGAGDWLSVLAYIIISLIAYFMGSFPSGYFAGRICKVDLQRVGSGSTGATNAIRALGKKWGYAVFVADFLKGVLAVLVSFAIADVPQWKGPSPVHLAVIASFFVIIGHSFPVWLGFKGGKGIATSAGIMLTLFPLAVFLSGLLVWLVLFFSTRFVSVASLGAAITLPTASFLLMIFGAPDALIFGKCDPILAVISMLMGGVAIWRHKDNIKRLLAGAEKRFERKMTRLS